MTTKNKSNYETAVMGNEPLWEDCESLTDDEVFSRLIKSLNWYNYFCSDEDYRNFVMEYFTKKDKNFAAKLKNIDKSCILFRKLGGMCRVLTLGGKLTPKDTELFEEYSSDMLTLCNKIKTPEPAVVTETKPSVQEHIQNKIVESISNLECKIDEFMTCQDYKEFLKTFNIEAWITNNKLKSYECSAISSFYSSKIQEPKEALEGKDPQLVEGYSHIGKVKLRKLVELLTEIVKVSTDYSLRKKERKPRKKKIKSPEVQVKKLKYKKSDSTLSLTSIDPRDIIGATKLMVYNTKYCKVCLYESETISGFGVKGSSIQNITKSICKKVRKPKDFFRGMGAGVRSVTNHFTSLKTKESEASPRINEHVILVKAFK